MKKLLSRFSPLWIIRLRAARISGMIAAVAFLYMPTITAADTTGETEYTNPLKDINSFPELLKTIAKAIVYVGTPLAAAAIVIIGVRMVIAAASGDTSGLTKSRTLLWYVLIGTAIIVGASAIAEAVIKFAQTGSVT